MLNKKITLDGREVEFTLTRNPRAKYLRVRILADCTVKVTSPPQHSIEYIEDFLRSKSGAILKALEKYSVSQADQKPFGTGCAVWSFGKPRALEIITADSGFGAAADSDGQKLTVRARDPAHAAALTEKWLAERLRDYLVLSLERYYPAVEKRGVEKPGFILKKMTSRWGSCSHRTHRLAFSTMLAEYPEEAIDYVVMHELAHFIHPNHSKEFYAFVAESMPDWKRRSDMLKAPRKNSAYFS